jgi:hypothetical protein
MENREWRTENGEQRMENREWRTENGELGNREQRAENGEWRKDRTFTQRMEPAYEEQRDNIN